VWDYRLERLRQKVQRERFTGDYEADIAHWKAKGGKLVTFQDWLKAHKR
jgi:hypothetical protein